MKIMGKNIIQLFFFLLVSGFGNALYAQPGHDSLRAKYRSGDWGPGLELSNEQQVQLKEMEMEFTQKLEVLKESNASGKEKSASISGVYAWRDGEISRILTPEQHKKYRERQEKLQRAGLANLEKVKAENKKKPKTSNPKSLQ
jgi:hypothetical protein